MVFVVMMCEDPKVHKLSKKKWLIFNPVGRIEETFKRQTLDKFLQNKKNVSISPQSGCHTRSLETTPI